MLYSPLRDSLFEYRLRWVAIGIVLCVHIGGLLYTFFKQPAVTHISLSVHNMSKHSSQKIYVKSGAHKITSKGSVALTGAVATKPLAQQAVISPHIKKKSTAFKKDKKKNGKLTAKEQRLKKAESLKKVVTPDKKEAVKEPIKPPVKAEEVKKIPEQIEPEKVQAAKPVVEQALPEVASSQVPDGVQTVEIPLDASATIGFAGQEAFVAQLRAAIPQGFYNYGVVRLVCKLDAYTGKATEFSPRTTEPLALYMAVKHVVAQMVFPRHFWGTHLELAIRI